MRKQLFQFLLFSFSLLFPFGLQASPKLVLLVVVDQMRADYLTRFSLAFKGGLKKMLEEGAVFENATVNFVPTDTAPGHAAIMTGRTPSENGIAGNWWRDRKQGKSVNSVKDDKFGVGPQNLLVPTLGDTLREKTPGSQVAALSIKDRAAILMGGRRANFALWFDSKKIGFTTSGFYGVLPDWVRQFNDENKPGILKIVGSKNVGKKFYPTTESDRLLSRLVSRALEKTSLGEDETPDLLAVSFSGTDYVGHKYGPESEEIKRQILQIDIILGNLFVELSDRLGPESFDVVLTADHGVAPSPGSAEGKRIGERIIQGKYFQENLKETLRTNLGFQNREFFSDIVGPNIYFNRKFIGEKKLDWEKFIALARRALKKCDGVAEVYDPILRQPKDKFWPLYEAGFRKDRGGDLMIRLKEGVIVEKYGSTTTHGSPYYYDQRVPLLFWGPDFKKGRFNGEAHIIDIAPTLAKVLGVDLVASAGSRVLSEALK